MCSFLLSGSWWRRSLIAALGFAPRCIVPASGLTIANIIIVVGLNYMYGSINKEGVTLDELTQAGLVGLASAILGLFITFWTLWLWILRLTVFAKAFLDPSLSFGKAELDQCESSVSKQGSYIAKFWFFASIYLCIPVLPLFVLMVLQILASPKFMAHGFAVVSLPQWASIAISACLFVLTLCAVGLSFICLAVSAVSALSPAQAATAALMLSLKKWVGVFAVSLCVLGLNCLISAPQILLSGLGIGVAGTNQLWLDIAFQVWLGFTSIFLWTLSVAPFCELIKEGCQ